MQSSLCYPALSTSTSHHNRLCISRLHVFESPRTALSMFRYLIPVSYTTLRKVHPRNHDSARLYYQLNHYRAANPCYHSLEYQKPLSPEPICQVGDNHVTEHHTSERIQRFSYARLAHIRLK